MCVSRMASRSEIESPREAICVRNTSKVDAGPGSRIAEWPPDSRSTAPIECGRPIQLRSSTVIKSIYGMVREHHRSDKLLVGRLTPPQCQFCPSLSRHEVNT